MTKIKLCGAAVLIAAFTSLGAVELCPTFSPEAVEKWKTKADAGDAESQFLYAWHLMGGLEMRGLLPDLDIDSCDMPSETVSNGMKYAEMAVNQGYGAANMLLAASSREECYALIRTLSKAMDNNDTLAKNTAEEKLKKTNQRIEDALSKHKAWVEAETEKGNPLAQFQLGIRWLMGCENKKFEKGGHRFDSVEYKREVKRRTIERVTRGVSLIAKSARQNYAPAKMYLLNLFERLGAECRGRELGAEELEIFSKLPEFDIKTKSDIFGLCVEFAKSAAEQGMPAAMVMMGYMCDDGIIEKMTEARICCPAISLDYEKALFWYRKAGKGGLHCSSAIKDIEETPKTFMGIEFGVDLEEFVRQRKGLFPGKDTTGKRVIGRDTGNSLPRFRMFDGENYSDGTLEGCPESRKIYGVIRHSSSISHKDIDAEFERTCEAFKKKYGEKLIDLGWPENDEFVDVPRLKGFVGRARSYRIGKMKINICYSYYESNPGEMVLHVYHEGYKRLAEYETIERMAKMSDGADVL